MIVGSILIVHFLAAVYAFLKYRKEGLGDGLLASAFVVIIFAVGWTVATMIAKVVYPSDLVAQWVTRMQETQFSRLLAKELSIDTFSLLLLTIGEIVFYYFLLRSERRQRRAGK
jgi:hypothetical protein